METKHCGSNYTAVSIGFYRKQIPHEHHISVNVLLIVLQMAFLEAVIDTIGLVSCCIQYSSSCSLLVKIMDFTYRLCSTSKDCRRNRALQFSMNQY